MICLVDRLKSIDSFWVPQGRGPKVLDRRVAAADAHPTQRSEPAE